MNRASHIEIRKAIEFTRVLTDHGILFVPMPVIDTDDHEKLKADAADRLNKLIEEASAGEPAGEEA